jgi:hypothetical protein
MKHTRPALCPCCSFPTLTENGSFEICTICWWEDDGQDDRDAGEVRGGPNSKYSLLDARKNFFNHGHMYDEGQGIEVVEKPSATRVELMAYLKNIDFEVSKADIIRVSALLEAEDRDRDRHRDRP